VHAIDRLDDLVSSGKQQGNRLSHTALVEAQALIKNELEATARDQTKDRLLSLLDDLRDCYDLADDDCIQREIYNAILSVSRALDKFAMAAAKG